MSVSDQLLKILSRVRPLGLTITVLQAEYRVTVGSLGDAEYADARQRLLDAGFVKQAKDALTGDSKLTITPKGIKRVNS